MSPEKQRWELERAVNDLLLLERATGVSAVQIVKEVNKVLKLWEESPEAKE